MSICLVPPYHLIHTPHVPPWHRCSARPCVRTYVSAELLTYVSAELLTYGLTDVRTLRTYGATDLRTYVAPHVRTYGLTDLRSSARPYVTPYVGCFTALGSTALGSRALGAPVGGTGPRGRRVRAHGLDPRWNFSKNTRPTLCAAARRGARRYAARTLPSARTPLPPYSSACAARSIFPLPPA